MNADTARELITPSLLVWPESIDANIDRIVQIAGDPGRLRPHCKTHKMIEVAQRLVAAGVSQHKASTVVEVDMLCRAGAKDVVLAGNPVGPSLTQLQQVVTAYPQVRISITADAEGPIRQASDESLAAGISLGVMIDLDVGLHRTGVTPDSPNAETLYKLVQSLSGLHPAGLHIYDGHHHQSDPDERTAAIQAAWQPVESLIHRLESADLPVPELLCGGTPSFPVYAKFENPRIRLSPGTCTLHDVGYGRKCPDLVFDVAAAVATRVVSNAVPGQLTLDVGHKAIAADPPADFRAVLPDLPDAEAIIHNEEHLTVTTEHAVKYAPGDLLFAFPVHICPTVALHESAIVIKDEVETDRWMIARHRILRDV
ncbi:MAG: alanine racemase [Fuerstiella sp.]|nr:alanine racemase [Fuerstiella sp.]